MRIEDYFQQVQETLRACLLIQFSNITYDKRGTHEGLVRGEVYFVDRSILHLREFIDVETAPERLLYVYQYLDPSHQLVFRCDNTGHHKKLNLSTFPHHRHESNNRVVVSSAPELSDVLKEIERLVRLP